MHKIEVTRDNDGFSRLTVTESTDKRAIGAEIRVSRVRKNWQGKLGLSVNVLVLVPGYATTSAVIREGAGASHLYSVRNGLDVPGELLKASLEMMYIAAERAFAAHKAEAPTMGDVQHYSIDIRNKTLTARGTAQGVDRLSALNDYLRRIHMMEPVYSIPASCHMSVCQ